MDPNLPEYWNHFFILKYENQTTPIFLFIAV